MASILGQCKERTMKEAIKEIFRYVQGSPHQHAFFEALSQMPCYMKFFKQNCLLTKGSWKKCTR